MNKKITGVFLFAGIALVLGALVLPGEHSRPSLEMVMLQEHPYEGPPCLSKYPEAVPSTSLAGTPSTKNYVVEYLPTVGGE